MVARPGFVSLLLGWAALVALASGAPSDKVAVAPPVAVVAAPPVPAAAPRRPTAPVPVAAAPEKKPVKDVCNVNPPVAAVVVVPANASAVELVSPAAGVTPEIVVGSGAAHTAPSSDMDSEPVEGRLYGGTKATAVGQYPYVAYIKSTMSDATTLECSGAVISETYVLTSAVCVYEAAQIDVTAGVISATGTGSTSKGVAIVYPTFRRYSMVNDLALIKLITPFQLTGTVAKVTFSTNSKINTLDGQTVRVVGFGATATDGTAAADLTYVDQNQITRTQCNTKMLPKWIEYPATMSCLDATDATKGACIGDRGAPVMYKATGSSSYVIAGMVSDYTTCGSNYPTAYTRIQPYITWISAFVTDISKVST